MIKRFKNYFINLIFPAFIFGSITGVLTSVVVTLYKVCAKYMIEGSAWGYRFLRGHLYALPLVLLGLLGLAALFAAIYRQTPNLRGGGIPTSIGILRGIIPFKWLRNLVGVFLLSLCSFFVGVPVGNEGPSVQMGTAIGRGSVFSLAKKHKAWDRYTMTGGACAGFSVATGAPISGILFAVEEAHQRISPMILLVSATSVVFSRITSELLAPLCGVSITLFPELHPVNMELKDIWLPVVVGVAMGIFAVLFLTYYRGLTVLLGKKLRKLPSWLKIFSVFFLTLLLGLCSDSFVSTGHELILELFEGHAVLWMLALILLVRSTLSICANATGITGGLFLPLLAIGTVLSALIGTAARGLFGLGHDYYVVILILGIAACISGMMKTPLTAIVFAVEALGCYENILFVIVAVTAAFIITEIFGAKSINDSVVDTRVEELVEGKTPKVIDTFVTVKHGSFAIGKQIRDIFWPANLFVLSLKHVRNNDAEVDEHGGKAIREGDVLHVRYSTYHEAQTREELTAIVGEQEYHEKEVDVI